jgi:hypothetical protein
MTVFPDQLNLPSGILANARIQFVQSCEACKLDAIGKLRAGFRLALRLAGMTDLG